MIFHSLDFVAFFLVIVTLYWRLPHRWQNHLLLVASYIFYGWITPWYLLLLMTSTTIDWWAARRMEQDPGHKRRYLALSLTSNLGMLAYFKYANFFIDNVGRMLTTIGLPTSPHVLKVMLPVGISFFTFQALSYTIHVYRGTLRARSSLLDVATYVAFFPQLVAGPIERASHLLPQFEKTVSITRPMLEEGVWLMLWGLFKKVVVADNLAPLADLAFGQSSHTAASVALGTLAFAFQIYGDFSGYSDIARGSARVLGFDIMWNFDLPYAARNLRDFWRRWHISLSTWLRDYLYISLGGNRRGPARTYVNLALTMGLGGLWHGAAWNFVVWGLWHGLGLCLQRAWHVHRARVATPPAPLTSAPTPTLTHTLNLTPTPTLRPMLRLLSWLATLLFVLYGWLLFRANSWHHIQSMTRACFHWSAPVWASSFALTLAAFSTPLILMELWQVRRRDRLVSLTLPPRWRGLLQGALLCGILLFWEKKQLAFIYFQF